MFNQFLTKKVSYNCGIGLIVLGLILSLLGLIFLSLNLIFLMIPRFGIRSSELGSIFVSGGLGLIAIGIAVVAINYSFKTDKLVKSLADLNFEEKIAAMTIVEAELQNIEDKIQNIETIIPNEIDESKKNRLKKELNLNKIASLKRICWDFKAVANLRKYASSEQKKGLLDIIDKVLTCPKDESNEKIIKEIEKTKSEFGNK